MISGQIVSAYGGHTYGSPDGALQALIRGLKNYEQVIIPRAMKRAMQRYLKYVSDMLIKRHSKPWPGGTTATSLSKRSGAAVRSIAQSLKVETTGSEVLGYIGGIYYLQAHEDGATIRARRSKYLTIPLPAALDQRGVPRKRSAREWSNTFIIKSKNNNLLIVQRTATGIVPLYVLKKQVRIPKRLGMGEALNRYLPTLGEYLQAELKGEFKI